MKKAIKIVLPIIAVVAVTLIALNWTEIKSFADDIIDKGKTKSLETETIVVNDDGQTKVTEVEVKTTFKEAGELYTTKATVSNYYKETKNMSVFGREINSNKFQSEVTYIYKATVKAGYDLDAVEVAVEGSQIIITLPKTCLIETTNVDVADTFEDDHWYNQIETENVISDMTKIEKDAIKQAKENGIEEEAKADFEKVINNWLATFEDQGYEIVVK